MVHVAATANAGYTIESRRNNLHSRIVKLEPAICLSIQVCFLQSLLPNTQEVLNKTKLTELPQGCIYLARRLGQVLPKEEVQPAVARRGAHLIVQTCCWPVTLGDYIKEYCSCTGINEYLSTEQLLSVSGNSQRRVYY